MTSAPFKPLDPDMRRKLAHALRSNGENGTAILMDPGDTSFVGYSDTVPTDEMISAVAAVPCHY